MTASHGAQAAVRPRVQSIASSSARLGSVQARRGVALIQQRQAVRSVHGVPPLTICRAAPPAKKAATKREGPPTAVAHLRFSRGSPSKVRRVLDQIRGRSYEEALMILEYTPYRACENIIKTLVSAGANAKNNLGLKKLKLYVSECYCDEGPILKRIKPRAKGRANQIKKLTNHISIRLQERET